MNKKSLLMLTIDCGLALAAVWLLSLVGFSSPEARAASFTVCSTGCDYNVIQDAVDAAGNGDVIKIAAGTYHNVNNHGSLAQVVYIVKSVTLQGGYTTAFTEPPDPVANPTTLDAGGQGRVIYIEGDISPTIAGFRITGGEAKNLGSPIGIDAGGGMLIVSASATLIDNYIFENSADSTHNGDGGGVYLYQSDATLDSNTIISNTAQRQGGGVMLHTSAAMLEKNTISANSAVTGGGIFLENSDAILAHNIISSNKALSSGGVHVSGSAANINNNVIVSNTATLNAGGGLFLWECDNASITQNTISNNSAGTIGGGFQAFGDNMLISGNTISHNNAEWGGGISPDGNNILVHGNTISYNSATHGGGGFFGDSPVILKGNSFISNTAEMGGGFLSPNATGMQILGNKFMGNVASSQGGGLDLWGGSPILTNNLIADNQSYGIGSGLRVSESSPHLLHNTIVRNTGGDGSGIYAITNSDVSITNTLIVSHTVGIYVHFDASASLEATLWGTSTWANTADLAGAGMIITGTTNIWGDPDFVDYLVGDYHIGANSDAIDAGIDAGVTNDFDFYPRPYQTPDIGADEYWPPGTLKFIYLPLVVK